jgi:hypothetical protein
MHSVSPRITGVGSGAELSDMVVAASACANDFGGGLLITGSTTMEGVSVGCVCVVNLGKFDSYSYKRDVAYALIK